MKQLTDQDIEALTTKVKAGIKGVENQKERAQQYTFVTYQVDPNPAAPAPPSQAIYVENRRDSIATGFLGFARALTHWVTGTYIATLPRLEQEYWPYVKGILDDHFAITRAFDQLDSLDQPLVADPAQPTVLHIGYQIRAGEERQQEAIDKAIRDFFQYVYHTELVSDVIPSEENYARDMSLFESDRQPVAEAPRAKNLFPNSKSIDQASQFGMPKFITDNLNRGIRNMNRQQAIKQYGRDRKGTYKIQNRETETEFVFDKEQLAIKTAEQFAEKLAKLKDAKVIQSYFGLMKWANLKDTPVFHNVPLSEIMELVLKSQSNNKFNTPDRRKFSEALEYLTSVSITVSVIGERVNKKTGKRKTVLQEENGVKLFRMKAEYSVRKEFQHIPRAALIKDIHFDKTVINHFSGELLPGNHHLFGQRGSVYFDTLLQFDANKDAKAILMGFTIQTRFNQMTDKERFIEMDRASLIELCDYQKTNQTKVGQATKQLANNLDKLKTAGIISRYSGLTNIDSDRVQIHPPTDLKGELDG